jgi:hypothetical protein
MTRRFLLPGVAVALLCASTFAWGQDPETPADSLADLARQTRAHHASTPDTKSSKAQELVDEMQQEQEAAANAPTGFTNYNAGDYRLFVPYPFSLEGRDNGGAVLLGSRLGITNTEVVAGNPIPIPANLIDNVSDSDLLNVVRQLAGLHGPQPYCAPIKQGSHKAFRCAWQGNPYLLGHVVWGSMLFIVGSNSLIPVMCVSPDDMHSCTIYDNQGHNTCSDRNRQMYGTDHRKQQAAVNAQVHDEQTTFQMCDQIIYPSIQLKEDIVVHPATLSEKPSSGKPPSEKSASASKAPAAALPVTAVATPTQETPPGESGSQSPSLAELARQTRQAPHDKAQATLDSAEGTTVAPPGFEPFVLQYCQNPQQCSEASVVIPEKAEVISRTNGQYIFKTALDGESLMLYAGPADVNAPYRSLTDPDYIRMRDLANANGWSREKPDSVSTQDLTIEGRSALMTRFRYQRDQKRWWIGERVLIDNQGKQFLVGCAAPEEHFADAEALCTTLVNSLRLP